MWKLLDIDGDLLEELNCHYDCIDFAVEEYNAKSVIFDFELEVVKITEYWSNKEGEEDE